MGDTTNIAWTDRTMNFWLGCHKVSPGCKNCYAERLVTGRMGRPDCWGPPATTTRHRTSAATWRKSATWNREAEQAGKPSRVFCGSLMDWAEDHPQLNEYRAAMWQQIRETPMLHWQLLTKRADRIYGLLPYDWGAGYPNVWLGVSIESMEQAGRADELRAVPAGVRFISYEPALGPIHEIDLTNIDWVICGGESGPGYREMSLDWARAMRDACRRADVPFFFKQSSGYRPGSGATLDGETIHEWPEGGA